MAGPTRYRQLQSPVGVDVLNTDTGGDQAARALSDAFSNFANVGTHLIGENRADQGAVEGAAAGAAGTPQPRSGFFGHTAYGQAYNSSAEAAYAAKMATDIDTEFNQYEQDYEGDLAGYTTVAKSYAEGLMAEVPAEYRTRVEQALNVRSAASGAKIRGQQIADQRDQQAADFMAGQDSKAKIALAAAEHLPREQGDAALAAAVADNAAGLQAMVDGHVISATTAVKWGAAFSASLDEGLFAARTSNVVEELMNVARVDFEKGDKLLIERLADPNLPDDDKLAIRKEYDAQRSALEEDRARVYVEAAGSLSKRLAAGEFGPGIESEARRLRRKGGISRAEYLSSLDQSQNNSEKKAEEEVDVSYVAASMSGGPGLDPADPKQRKAVDTYFDHEVAAAGMTPGDTRWSQKVVEMTKKTNILPKAAESFVRVGLMGDPLRAANAAALFDRIQDANPVAWDYSVDPKIAPFAAQLNANVKNMEDPVRAHEVATANVYGMKDEEKKRLALEYSGNKKELNANADALQDALDSDSHFNPPGWDGAPAATLAMKAEYDNLVGQYYVWTNGNLEQARTIAGKAIMGRGGYGVTEMNGKREVIKLAPERVYPGMTAPVIRDDLYKSVASLNTLPQIPNPALLRIIPSSDTERSKGRWWNVAVFDEDGNHELIRGPDNRPLPYSMPLGPDFSAARDALKAAKVAESVQASARAAKRDEILFEMDQYEGNR